MEPKSFTDNRGNRGKVGSKVYYWMETLCGGKIQQVYTVERIYKGRKTLIVLEGAPLAHPAKNFVILKDGETEG